MEDSVCGNLFVCYCRSWQTLKFDKQPASFIRIVGTHNTANEVTLSDLELNLQPRTNEIKV